jgi:1-acyl-sn-glycerol-3-phosphate acyltransferase
MGEVLVLYPEGERKDGPIVQPLFDGAAYVAAKAGVPIVPVGIGGSDRVMPRGARFVFPHKVHVEIGRPIPAPIGAGERLPRTTLKEHSDRLHAELQLLYDEAQRRVGRDQGAPEGASTK